MLATAVLFFDSTHRTWRYRVFDAGALIDEGEMPTVPANESSAELVYRLRHRWPVLTADAVGVLRGPSATRRYGVLSGCG